MHTLVLCLWVLGTVSAADDQFQRPIYIIAQNGTPPGYSSGQPFFGAPVTSNNVRVLPNAYGSSQDVDTSSVTTNPISVPVIVNRNTPFQGNTDQPIPVPVSYSTDDGSISTAQSQPVYETNPLTLQRAPSGVTPVPVLVKAPASAYRTIISTPRPFEVTNSQSTNENSLVNPYSVISPSFRLWPKLPEPVPVPVLIAEAFVQNSYRNLNTNLIPQYLQKTSVPIKAPASFSNSYQQNPIPVKYPDSSQLQTQPNQSANQSPIYIIIPGGTSNAQSSSFQSPAPAQTSYQSQTPQSGNQGFIIVVPPGANSQSSQSAYQNNGYSSNQNYGNQLQGQYYDQQQSPLNYAVINPSNAYGSQTQAQSSQQVPLNFGLFTSSNAPSSQSQAQPAGQQSALKYAIYGPAIASGSSANSAEQAPQNYAVFAPASAPGSQSVSSNTASQPPLVYSAFGSPNGGSSFQLPTPSPSQFVGYSSTQPPSKYVSYSSSTQSPQYVGYSTTPATSQTSYSQSTPVTRVSFSGAGSSYSYTV